MNIVLRVLCIIRIYAADPLSKIKGFARANEIDWTVLHSIALLLYKFVNKKIILAFE